MAILRPHSRLALALAWHEVGPQLLTALILVGLGVGVTCFMVWREDSRTRDLQGAPILQATATVESVSSNNWANGKGPVSEFQVRLRVGEKRGYVFVPIRRFSDMAKGREVRAFYQIGKSGELYIGRVEPL